MGPHAFAGPRAPAAVLVALRRLVRFIRLGEHADDLGLSAAQRFVLHSLRERPAASMADLAARTLTQQRWGSTVWAKPAARGVVARKPRARDRRRVTIELTAAGRTAIAKSTPLPQQRIAETVAAMTPRNQARLVGALPHLIAALGADALAPSMFFEDGVATPSDQPARAKGTRARAA